MKSTSKTIIFFGSGPVAAASLELLSQSFEIEAVITKPRAHHHKGAVPVIDIANKLNIKLLTASSKKEVDNLFEQKPASSQTAILIDFGIIVSQKVINYFPKGIINSHFSLLPEWRGADPITFSILSGQKKTGVSLMLLTAAMDEGPLLAQSVYELSEKTTTPELTNDLIELSYKMLHEIVPLYLNGKIDPMPQSYATLAESLAPTYSRKLTKDDSILDWDKPAEALEREIRAFAGWPKSRTRIANKDVVITQASVIDQPQKSTKPGDITTTATGSIIITTKNGALRIGRLKPAGKREMSSAEFIRGYGAGLLRSKN